MVNVLVKSTVAKSIVFAETLPLATSLVPLYTAYLTAPSVNLIAFVELLSVVNLIVADPPILQLASIPI